VLFHILHSGKQGNNFKIKPLRLNLCNLQLICSAVLFLVSFLVENGILVLFFWEMREFFTPNFRIEKSSNPKSSPSQQKK
jgi:hypothetical protein